MSTNKRLTIYASHFVNEISTAKKSDESGMDLDPHELFPDKSRIQVLNKGRGAFYLVIRTSLATFLMTRESRRTTALRFSTVLLTYRFHKFITEETAARARISKILPYFVSIHKKLLKIS